MSTMKMIYQDYIKKNQDYRDNIATIYITGIDYEDRSNISTINEIFKNRVLPNFSIVLCNNELSEKIGQECVLGKSGKYIQYCNKDSTNLAVNLLDQIKNYNDSQYKIIINTTAIKKETLLVVLFALRNILKVSKMELVYITPEKYGEYIINGYNEPYCISFAQGMHQIGLPSLLLLMSGYERDGEFGLVRYYQPIVFLAGYAEPPTEEDFVNRNIENFKEIVQTFANDEGIIINELTFSGNDPEKCCIDIINYLKEHSLTPDKYNIYVAPMNNKLTSIGAYLAYEGMPQIQLVDIIGERGESKSLSIGKKSVYIIQLESKQESEENSLCSK